jgi:hypothetical protein
VYNGTVRCQLREEKVEELGIWVFGWRWTRGSYTCTVIVSRHEPVAINMCDGDLPAIRTLSEEVEEKGIGWYEGI